MKRIMCILLAVLMVLPMVACGAAAPAEEVQANTVVDLLGREINVPEEVNRIAAIAGPTYEMVFMLGGADKIVMVKSGHTDSYPLANLTNPKLKDMAGLAANPSSTVNIEDYLKQDIDLVVYYDNEIELKKFDAVDMAAVVASKNTGLLDSLEQAKALTIDEFIAKLTQPLDILSTALNDPEARAEYETWRNYCDEKLRMVYERTKDIPMEDRKTVYWGNTWGEEIRSTYALKNRWFEVYLAGGQLIGPEENSNFPEVTAEQLFSWDPDIILVDNHGGLPGLVMESMYREGSRWSTLSAVQNKQLHRIPAGVFFLDKGSTTTLLVLWMATFLQPELFSDIDMIEEVKYYYSEFYEFELTDEQAQNVIDGWVIDDE
ncbi:MAG: ABC transporter substrate-binding protein [Oscillospiraceae bacterium]|nr:ABC transporter substrate-binding protein [Oscillospiraceae bacterium]MBQ7130823.1 ABC transporter substrate-binding protein [Oscillospiraceae bacterium]